ncbi:NOXA1 oxidase, partial [Eubucco bourcierii]|nr:NOXA1 oxidase [Eubucco bourcierii]
QVISSIIPNDEYFGFEPLRFQKQSCSEASADALRGSEVSYWRVVSHYCPEGWPRLAVPAGSLVCVLARGAEGWATAIHGGQTLRIPSSLLEPASHTDSQITDGIPLPPAQVPPSRLPVKQKPGSAPGLEPPWVPCEPLPASGLHREPGCPLQPCWLQVLTAAAVPLLLSWSAESAGGEEASTNGAGTQRDEVKSALSTSVPCAGLSPVVLCPSGAGEPRTGHRPSEASCSVDRPLVLRASCECSLVVRAGLVPSVAELRALLRERFGQQAQTGRLSYRHTDGTELGTVSGEEDLEGLWQQLTDGSLGLCCQDSDSHSARPVLYRMLAQHPYPAQGPGDLEFSKGDLLDVLSEVNEDWLEGRCNGRTGIFPRCFATQTTCGA